MLAYMNYWFDPAKNLCSSGDTALYYVSVFRPWDLFTEPA